LVASFVWMLLAEPTYNRTRLAALAWRARILSQKALRNVSRLSPGFGASLSARRDLSRGSSSRLREVGPVEESPA